MSENNDHWITATLGDLWGNGAGAGLPTGEVTQAGKQIGRACFSLARGLLN